MTKEYEEELDENNYVMRDKPAVHALVEAAVENGWEAGVEYNDFTVDRNSHGMLVITFGKDGSPVRAILWRDLLWNIPFNQAAWGDQWQQRMKDMVVLENVFPYIHGHLPQKETLDNQDK